MKTAITITPGMIMIDTGLLLNLVYVKDGVWEHLLG